jgi:hypothetical protein
MRDRIGFDRELKLDWLDEIVENVSKEKDSKVIKAQMSDYINKYDLVKGDAVRKTIQVLNRIWLNVPEEHIQIRDEGRHLFHLINKDDRIWLHWGMSLIAYPFFRDIAEIIGMLHTLQDEVTMEQIGRRFTERWGSRTTAKRAINRVIRSMVWWGILQKTEKTGVYIFSKPITTDQKDLQKWFVNVLILANNANVTPLDQVFNQPFSFPFRLTLDLYELKKSERLRFYREGSGLEMVTYLDVVRLDTHFGY